MSIFKNDLSQFVRKQLKTRQEAIFNRTREGLQYINGRNAWVRMSSSVDVDNDEGDLARKYILQGGTLKIPNKDNLKGASLKAGLGKEDSAYNATVGKYSRGIRPIPGITSVEINSKSAYGSLREVIVQFQCWDLKQLEDLEVLYMRPGYTVLIEWGWVPYLDNNGNYKSNFIDYYNIINPKTKDRTQIFKELYDKCKAYSGNYDAMLGTIRNYSWNARQDGGYDCQVTVVSIGEIVESLKVNYGNIDLKETKKGILTKKFTYQGKEKEQSPWIEYYQKYNRLAGMWAEIFYKLTAGNPSPSSLGDYSIQSSSLENYKSVNIPLLNTPSTNNSERSLSTNSSRQVYITLGEAFELIQDYIIPKDQNSKPLIELSLDHIENDDTNITGSLLCTAHPLQISVDPSVCLINSPYWISDKENIVEKTYDAVYNSKARKKAEAPFILIREGYKGFSGPRYSNFGTYNDKFLEGVKKINDLETLGWVDYYIKNDGYYGSLQDAINGEFEGSQLSNVDPRLSDVKYIIEIKDHLASIASVDSSFDFFELPFAFSNATSKNTKDIKAYNSFKKTPGTWKSDSFIINYPKQDLGTIQSVADKSEKAIANIQFLKKFKPYFNSVKEEIGIIKNIYVNVDFLFKKAIDSNLQALDKKEKNEINLYAYLKSIISAVQSAIGNVSSFELHVIDNKTRIIDVNYTQQKSFNELFKLEIQNINSIIRTYTLQSQIFPEQGAIIAISSQAKGGQLGMQNNTLIDFNRKITDRIITNKNDGSGKDENKIENNKPTLSNGLWWIIEALNAINKTNPVNSESIPDISSLFSSAKNSLRDIIVYIQAVTKSPGSNRNIIPTKFSFELDGIGGLVIGHMFKLPQDTLPKGYKGEGYGAELGQVITKIGHSISKGDWITKIETLNVVLNGVSTESNDKISFIDLILGDMVTNSISSDEEAKEAVEKATNAPLSPLSTEEAGMKETNAKRLEKKLLTLNIKTRYKYKLSELESNKDIDANFADLMFELLSNIRRDNPNIYIEVTGGNDVYHQDNKPNSLHVVGKGLDFAVTPEYIGNINVRVRIESTIENFIDDKRRQGIKLSYANEYKKLSEGGTGGHFHIQLSS
jgi:hypothetical protein